VNKGGFGYNPSIILMMRTVVDQTLCFAL